MPIHFSNSIQPFENQGKIMCNACGINHHDDDEFDYDEFDEVETVETDE